MKVNCFVQARMSSERLPGKIMHKIGNKPMIGHILDSLAFTTTVSETVVAATTDRADDQLADYLAQRGCKCFRGSADDVLSRFAGALRAHPADYVVRITADNPLTDPEMVDSVVRLAASNKCDYASNHLHKTFPLGYVVEVVSAGTLCAIAESTSDPADREHVTWHIRRNRQGFRTKNLAAPAALAHPDWRLTVDTGEDLALVRLIFDALYRDGSYIGYAKVVDHILKNPELLQMNSHVQQRRPC